MLFENLKKLEEDQQKPAEGEQENKKDDIEVWEAVEPEEKVEKFWTPTAKVLRAIKQQKFTHEAKGAFYRYNGISIVSDSRIEKGTCRPVQTGVFGVHPESMEEMAGEIRRKGFEVRELKKKELERLQKKLKVSIDMELKVNRDIKKKEIKNRDFNPPPFHYRAFGR